MKDSRVRIVSDGTSFGTRVYNSGGMPIPNVARIEILPIEPDGIVQARVTLNCVELNVMAEAHGTDHEQEADDAQTAR